MVGHEYNDPERGPTKIEVTNHGDHLHKKVFTKPHANAEWEHQEKEDKKGKKLEYKYSDSEGGTHVATHLLGPTRGNMYLGHT